MDRDRLAVNTLRFLAVDMVERARSGHPGAPLGLAPAAHVLWSRFLRFDPAAPDWPGRDRFVLSCGHASALLYALLHLAGFDLPLAELERFRQLGSRTPGHPEHGLTPGVETTTGPLGQGLANAVGMALAARLLAARFDRPGQELFAHAVWVFASDGDLMEGVASEACSLAGHQRLGRLRVVYDDNGITIDGPTDLAFSERVGDRFAAYGWRVETVADGDDLAALERAFGAAAAEEERPTLVVVRTVIGHGSPSKQGRPEVHGSPLGAEETRLTKAALGWPPEASFLVPDAARAAYDEARRRGAAARADWLRRRARLEAEDPARAAELARRLAGELPAGWDTDLPVFPADPKGRATRVVSGQALNLLAARLPELAGGSADLAPSNNTLLAGEADASPASPGGRNLRFGVREHAMGAVLNGMALAGGVRPYGGTFLVFSDYMRPAIRLAALMELPALYVFTHDSVFLGEDGPTHQPVDQLASLRAIPGLVVLRPADANETVAAWRTALLRREGPTALALTRQAVPVLPGTAERAGDGVPRGGYVLAETGPERAADLLLLATGSEVALALEAARELGGRGVACRVVSLPSWELFSRQETAYRDAVLPPAIRRRLAVEAGASHGWHRFVGDGGAVLGIDRFGASAPEADLARLLGMTVERVVEEATRLLAGG